MSLVSSKRFPKLFVLLILSFALFVFPMLHVSAVSGEDFLYVVEFSDSSQGATVVIDIGAPFVLTESRANHDDALISFSNGVEYTLTYVGEFVDGELSAWTTYDSSILENLYTLDDDNVGYPVQYEEVTATYFNTSGELVSASTTITGAFGDEDMHFIQVESIRDFKYSPGVLMNKRGMCVGLLFGSDTALSILFDSEIFESGAGTETPAPTETPGNPGGGTVVDDPGTDLPDPVSPSPSPTPEVPEGPAEDTYTLIGYDGDGKELFRLEDTNAEGFAVFELPDAPERDGYVFRGWADAKGGSAAYSKGDELRLSEAGTKSVYAVYGKSSVPVWVYALVGVIAAGLIAGIVVVIVKQKRPQAPPVPIQTPPAPVYTEPADVPIYVKPPEPPRPPVIQQPDNHRAGLVLCCTGGYQDGRNYPIGEGPIKIGRTAECVIRYPDGTPGVSHLHAVLFWRNGVLMLQDTSSTDTYLKRMGKLVKNQPVPVNVGDVFYVGERKNRFEIMRG